MGETTADNPALGQDLAAAPAPASKHQTYANGVLAAAKAAADVMASWDQAQTDAVVTAVFEAAWAARIPLAEAAHAETGIGVVADKITKNAWASLAVYEDLIGVRTVGVIADDARTGQTIYAIPRGPVLALTPLTNPTSTVIHDVLIALKTRNPLILSPHRAARKCSKQAADLLRDAAVAAGAPEGAIQVITKADKAYLEVVMAHRHLAVILATTTQKMVQAAQATGRPVIGVGAGNVPAYVHASADVAAAARMIFDSKTFDNGTVCASEQALVVDRGVAAALRRALETLGAVWVPPDKVDALGALSWDVATKSMKPDVVGREATDVAARIGLDVPAGTRLLVAPLDEVGPLVPLCHEVLGPVIALYEADNAAAAFDRCRELLKRGGLGHTAVVHATDEAVFDAASQLPVHRVLLNQPATQGALGGFTNTLTPSLSLSCGAVANNDFAANVSVSHLLETRIRVRHVRTAWANVASQGLVDQAGATAAAARASYREGASAESG